jgi:hypothetical protein
MPIWLSLRSAKKSAISKKIMNQVEDEAGEFDSDDRPETGVDESKSEELPSEDVAGNGRTV